MSLLLLPTELILEITSHLLTSEIELLAQTFNKRLYTTCRPLLSDRITAHRNTKCMRDRFGTPKHLKLRRPVAPHVVNFLDVDPEYLYTAPYNTPNLDFLNLKGDFKWLWRPNPVSYYIMEPMDPSLLDKLVVKTEELGLVLPPAFIRFFRDHSMVDSFIIGNQSYDFLLNKDPLKKCPASVDRGAGGYVVQFSANPSRIDYLYLYLCKGGYCILGSPCDMSTEDRVESLYEKRRWDVMVENAKLQEGEEEEARRVGMSMAYLSGRETSIRGTDFEEFLVMIYCRDSLSMGHIEIQAVSALLTEYVVNVYVEKRHTSGS